MKVVEVLKEAGANTVGIRFEELSTENYKASVVQQQSQKHRIFYHR